MTLSDFSQRILVTGGAGFIGSNFLLRMVPKCASYLWVNVDCLTYAGNLSNLSAIEPLPNYVFEKVNITDDAGVKRLFEDYKPTGIIHFAAESHVDRSIENPAAFLQTNVIGTFNLLEQARLRMVDEPSFRFHQVSTDEVYGSQGEGDPANENSPHRPSSPYAASKAAADDLVRAYGRTYGMNVVVSCSSNNYGPFQFPEKLIPLIIRNAMTGVEIPLYGDGRHVRDWLFVDDHCDAIETVYQSGHRGSTYLVAGGNSMPNLEIARHICRLLDARLGGDEPREDLITYVSERPGHDRRYAIDSSTTRRELNWRPKYNLADGLERTVNWYLDHRDWLDACISGAYLDYYERNYAHR